MRSEVIDLRGASQEALDSLRGVFKELGEPILEDTTAFQSGSAGWAFLFYTNCWGGSDANRRNYITIKEFITKYKKDVKMTKAQWIIGLLNGERGEHSGNSNDVYICNERGLFKTECGRRVDMNDVSGSLDTKFWFLPATTKMTLSEIENQLGIENLEIVKEK